MIDRLRDSLDRLFTLLSELGEFQLKSQTGARAQVKSTAGFDQAWVANEVFSEVDLETERRLIAFCGEAYGEVPLISEEFNAQTVPAGAEYYIVLDPLDGTRPYLEGKCAFGISIGVLHRGDFTFGCNYYPAYRTFHYAFADAEGVFDQHHRRLPVPEAWKPECYISLGFYDMFQDGYRDPKRIAEVLGVRVGDYARCATYIFKRIIEGRTCAYLSRDVYLWDIGPSSLLLKNRGFQLVDLQGTEVDFARMARPPFRHPAVVALPKGGEDAFLSRLRKMTLDQT